MPNDSVTPDLYAAICPECEFEFEIEAPDVDEVIVCDDCALNLIVKSVDPTGNRIQLELTETEADDWGE